VLAIEQAACIADTSTCFTSTPDANSTVFLEQLQTAITTLETSIAASEALYEAQLATADPETWIQANWASELAEFDLPANIQAITTIYTEDDFYFLLRSSPFNPEDMLSVFWNFPAFCGEVPYGSAETIFEVCPREMSLFITYVLQAEKTEAVCDDLDDESCYGDSEFIERFAKTVETVPSCVDAGICTAADY